MKACKHCLSEVNELTDKYNTCKECEIQIDSYLDQFCSGKNAEELNYLYTTTDLKEYASLLKIAGRSKMNKLQLCMAVESAMQEREAAAAVENMKAYHCDECGKATNDFENIGDKIFCNDCLHIDDEEFEALINELENFKESETAEIESSGNEREEYTFRVTMENESFNTTIKSAKSEGDAWYLVEKQFDEAQKIELISVKGCRHRDNETINIPGTLETITICHTCGYEL